MDTTNLAKTLTIAGFAAMAAAPAALVLGQEISYRVRTMRMPKMSMKVPAFVNVTNQILSH